MEAAGNGCEFKAWGQQVARGHRPGVRQQGMAGSQGAQAGAWQAARGTGWGKAAGRAAGNGTVNGTAERTVVGSGGAHWPDSVTQGRSGGTRVAGPPGGVDVQWVRRPTPAPHATCRSARISTELN